MNSLSKGRRIDGLLPAYLGRQRWFAGDPPSTISVVARESVGDGLEWMVVEVGDALYQVVVATRPKNEVPASILEAERIVLGEIGDDVLFDATFDADCAAALLALALPGVATDRVRHMGGEQSNTSLVFDDRLVLKLFRRLHPGPNPDVEIPAAVGARGFAQVATPIGVWQRDGFDLAVCVPFLAGGAEGWMLALASLRELCATDESAPEADSDLGFATEAGRLGGVTAELHLALAEAFGDSVGDTTEWATKVEAQAQRLADGDLDAAAARKFVERLRAVSDPGAAVRVHGDYHLGQVMRTEAGWIVLDFEGEPARSLEERRQPTSPLKDVAGMLRSFQYAAAVVLGEQDEAVRGRLVLRVERWEKQAREAFLRAYWGTDGIGALLPAPECDRATVLAAFEFDKAVYEVLYERAHRPSWTIIPLQAARRLVHA